MDTKRFIKELLREFHKSVSKYDDAKELEKLFKETLLDSYQRLSERNPSNEEKVMIALGMMYEDYPKYDIEEKRKLLVVDPAFDQIRQLSVRIFEFARAISEGKECNKEHDWAKIIEKFDKLKESVRHENQTEATKLISEAVLDLGFIENPDTNAISFRLSHCIIKKDDDRELI